MDALHLSPAERPAGPVEAQITQPDLQEELDPLSRLLQDVSRQLRLVIVELDRPEELENFG